MKNATDGFRRHSQKRFKNYFLYITKQILFIRAEHRRRIHCATNFASLLFELNLLVKNSLLIF